jgi:protein-S-isoprenylcysteine O-methyltransferase Ste14
LNRTSDAPEIVIFPPLVPLATVAASILLQSLFPLNLLANLGVYARVPSGAMFLAIGLGLMAGGGRALRKKGTNVLPSQPAVVLVNNGIFAWSRNPMYLGGSTAMLGLAFVFALDWLLLLLPLSLLILHHGIIKREELYLERKFGDDYRRYAQRVCRYFGRSRQER